MAVLLPSFVVWIGNVMIVGHQFYFYSKKFLNSETDTDFINAKNQYLREKIPNYENLKPLEKWHAVTHLLEMQLSDLNIDDLLPESPKMGLQRMSLLQKELEHSRKDPKYFSDLLSGFEKLIFIFHNKHPVYQIHIKKKKELIVDIEKLIRANPKGLELRVKLYELVHLYRGGANWIARELEKSRLKCLKDISSSYQGGLNLSCMKIAARRGVWEFHELIDEDKLSDFSLQAVEHNFNHSFQKVFGSYLTQALDRLTDYAFEEISQSIAEQSPHIAHQAFCVPKLFKPSKNKTPTHLTDEQYQQFNRVFQKLFGKPFFPELLEHGRLSFKALSDSKERVRAEILHILQSESYLMSFNDLLSDSKKIEDLFLVGPLGFEIYKSFYYQLNAEHHIHLKINGSDTHFLQFSKFLLNECRQASFQVKYHASKIILQKLIFENLDQAIQLQHQEKIKKYTEQLISFNQHTWSEMYHLSALYYQEDTLMQILLQKDPFLAVKRKDISFEDIHLLQLHHPEMQAILTREELLKPDFLQVRKHYFLNILYSENQLTEAFLQQHMHLLNMDEFSNVLRIRYENGLLALPGFHASMTRGLFAQFRLERANFEKMPDKIFRVQALYDIFESNQDEYHQFKHWYRYHCSVGKGLEVGFKGVALYCFNFVYQLILGLIQILLTILLLSLYLLSAFLVRYCSLNNQYTEYLTNLSCHEIPNIFWQWTKPLQELTNQCTEELSEFIHAWEKVEWRALAV